MTVKRPNTRVRLVARWLTLSLFTVALLAGFLVYLTRPDRTEIAAAHGNVDGLTSVLNKSVDDGSVPIRFENVTEGMDIDFVHFPTQRSSLLPEDMGSGVACADYDDDGFIDLFFVNFAGSVRPE